MAKIGERKRRDWGGLLEAHLRLIGELDDPEPSGDDEAAPTLAAAAGDDSEWSYEGYDVRPEAALALGHVFLSVVGLTGGTTRILGLHSSASAGWSRLETELEDRHLSAAIETLELSRWPIDAIEGEEPQVVGHLFRDECPLCLRRSFLVDVMNTGARCKAPACGAWILPNDDRPGLVDAGWPHGHQMAFALRFEDAVNALRGWGSPVTLEAGESSYDEVEDEIAKRLGAGRHVAPKTREERLANAAREAKGRAAALLEPDAKPEGPKLWESS